MYLFRIHIRPTRDDEEKKEETFAYCLKNNILGVGWRLDEYRHITKWDEYETEATTCHDNISQCKYINKWVEKGSLVWTRNTRGEYYLARVLSGWEYWQSEEAIEKDIDIANIFRCDFMKVPIDSVPGKVIACFRPSRTIQEIADHKTREYSKYLWNKKTGKDLYEINFNDKGEGELIDIFTMLDDEETEDAVFLYLQSKGWFVVPNSRKADTMGYEYLLVDRNSRKKARVQVKTGQTRLDTAQYSGSKEHIFLFQSQNFYDGNEEDNVTCIPPREVEDFLLNSKHWLPEIFIKKMEIVETFAKRTQTLKPI